MSVFDRHTLADSLDEVPETSFVSARGVVWSDILAEMQEYADASDRMQKVRAAVCK
jgi:hypothetical protein